MGYTDSGRLLPLTADGAGSNLLHTFVHTRAHMLSRWIVLRIPRGSPSLLPRRRVNRLPSFLQFHPVPWHFNNMGSCFRSDNPEGSNGRGFVTVACGELLRRQSAIRPLPMECGLKAWGGWPGSMLGIVWYFRETLTVSRKLTPSFVKITVPAPHGPTRQSTSHQSKRAAARQISILVGVTATARY